MSEPMTLWESQYLYERVSTSMGETYDSVTEPVPLWESLWLCEWASVTLWEGLWLYEWAYGSVSVCVTLWVILWVLEWASSAFVSEPMSRWVNVWVCDYVSERVSLWVREPLTLYVSEPVTLWCIWMYVALCMCLCHSAVGCVLTTWLVGGWLLRHSALHKGSMTGWQSICQSSAYIT